MIILFFPPISTLVKIVLQRFSWGVSAISVNLTLLHHKKTGDSGTLELNLSILLMRNYNIIKDMLRRESLHIILGLGSNVTNFWG